MDPPHPVQREPVLTERPAGAGRGPGGPLPLLARGWFWVLLIGLAFSIPLIKTFTGHLPPMLPGQERAPEELELPDESGAPVALASLRGKLVVVTTLPLASSTEREETMKSILALRKHLRGLDQALVVAVFCRGGGATELSPLLDAHKARKPSNIFLLDEGGAAFAGLATAAGAPSAKAVLLDRHGRIRGVYGEGDAEQQRLIAETGQIANWPAEDAAPAGG